MPTTQEIQQQITSAASNAGVPTALALAIAQQESSFDPNAVNTANNNGTADYGVMQINSSNLPSLGLTPSSVMDPSTNINAGVGILAQLWAQYGDAASVASAYNTGSPNNTSSSYVSSVLANMANYGGAVGGGADLYTSVSATSAGDTDTSGDTTIDLSSIGLGVITLTPEVIIGTAAALAGLLWLMNKSR